MAKEKLNRIVKVNRIFSNHKNFVKVLFTILLAFWTILFILSLLRNINETDKEIVTLAKAEAICSIEKEKNLSFMVF